MYHQVRMNTSAISVSATVVSFIILPRHQGLCFRRVAFSERSVDWQCSRMILQASWLDYREENYGNFLTALCAAIQYFSYLEDRKKMYTAAFSSNVGPEWNWVSIFLHFVQYLSKVEKTCLFQIQIYCALANTLSGRSPVAKQADIRTIPGLIFPVTLAKR